VITGTLATFNTAVTATGTVTAPAFSGPLTGAVTGNASTATALQIARAINGTNFDGTAAITVTAAAGTLTGGTLNATVLASSLTSVGTLASLAVTGAVTSASLTTTGDITVGGNFTVNGTTTTINATTLAVSDLNITIAKDATTAASANGAGLTVAGTAAATILYTSATDTWNFNKNVVGTLATAAQTAITSVGTLSGLTVTAPIAGSVTGTAATITGVYSSTLTSAQVTNALTFTPYNATNPAAYVTAAVTLTTAAQTAITSVGTLTGLTVSGTLAASANNTINIGAAGTSFATVYATTFSGVSTTAKYADLAENYQADKAYTPGTVIMFGGSEEVTVADADTTAVAGIISTNPAHLMNGGLTGANVVPLALQGRVPCNVIGPVKKGDMLVSAGYGFAKASKSPLCGQVIGKALNDFSGAKGQIEVVCGRV
jgi:hypothetical protein